jgi:N-acetyl sugar amidotransferase
MDTSDATLTFSESGLCQYCQNFDANILPNWRQDESSSELLFRIADRIRANGKGREFDCIMGVSGGLDSSYATYIIKEKLGLRPLLFHVDAGWNTDQAVGNIEKLVDGLGLDLFTEVINWEEIKDLQVAFLKSQVAHQDIPQDTAFFSVLYRFARQHDIKYVITGGNYSTECCREPEEWGAYPGIDEMLIRDIHRRFGSIPLRSFPIVDVFDYKVYYTYVHGMMVVKPLDLVRYRKADAEALLAEKFGWEKFQHKHHESRFTRFVEDFWLPRKFGYDRRRAHFSSLIMTGQMTRENALDRVRRPELDEHFAAQEFNYVANKLDLSTDELRAIFLAKNRNCDDYRNKRWVIDIAGWVMSMLGVDRRLYR